MRGCEARAMAFTSTCVLAMRDLRRARSSLTLKVFGAG